jgi:hypothetical protein
VNLVQQALLLEKQGFRIMPMKGKAQPLVDGFGADDPTFTCDPSEFAPPATHIGLLCGPCPALGEDWLLCVDFDGEFGEVPELMAFWNALGTPEPTMASHDGAHLFYRVPPSADRGRLKQWTDVFATKAATGCAVDLKWAGGYAAESWDWDSDTNPLELVDALQYLPPAAMRALLASPRAAAAPARPRAERPDTWPVIYDYDRVHAAAIEWVKTKAPLAVSGNGGHNTTMGVACKLVGDFGLGEDVALEILDEHYNPRLEEPWDYEQLAHKARDADLRADITYDMAKRAMQDAYAEKAKQSPLYETLAIGITAPGDIPTADATGLKLSPLTGWPWILQSNNQFWLHAIDKPEYDVQCVRPELGACIARCLDKQIDEKNRGLAELQNVNIKVVSEVQMTYSARKHVYDPDTNRLTLAALRWTQRDPVFHEDIDRWLRALFGPLYEAGEQWLASLTTLERPAPCLFLTGPKQLGKSLLACGLAALWRRPEPATLVEAISSFNESTAECPLVFSDEELPKDMSFGAFREMITSHSRRVNRKGLSKITLIGCVRVIIAANNDQVLRYQKTGALTRADLDAIADRLLVIRCHDAAREVVQTLDTDAVAQYRLAEHVLHLAATVPLEAKGQRMAAKPGGGESLLGKVVANRHSEILMRLKNVLDGVEDLCAEFVHTKDRPSLQFLPTQPQDELLLQAQGFFSAMRKDPSCRVSLNDLQEFCDAHKLRNSEQHKLQGRNLMWRVLNLTGVREALEGLD